MWRRPGAKRLTWNPDLQFPFESGWSLFHKVKVLNNLKDRELVNLIAREPIPLRGGRLRDCADSSWIDFDCFSELLEVPATELKNGFWDQLGIEVMRPKEYELRHCKMCWGMHRYHCVLFDLVWVKRCPWHGCPVGLPNTFVVPPAGMTRARGEPPSVPFDELLSLMPMGHQDKCRLIEYVLEYLEWWHVVQARVPQADRVLSSLVSTVHTNHLDSVLEPYEILLSWQAGYVQSLAPLQNGTWILQDVRSYSSRYAKVMDTGMKDPRLDIRCTIHNGTGRGYKFCVDGSSIISEDTGHCYRSIRRHVFRRYVRRHRTCLRRLAQINREDLLSLAASGVCTTCLAYAIWRMSIENLAVIDGLFTRRDNDYELRLTEPMASSPSDDPTRLRFTYMQFFGLWASIIHYTASSGFRVTTGEGPTHPNVVFARDKTQPDTFPLRVYYCVYPDGDALTLNAGRACKSPWKLLTSERQCFVQSQEWLKSWTLPKKLLQVYSESGPYEAEMMRQLRI